jgi:hypothetical protein
MTILGMTRSRVGDDHGRPRNAMRAGREGAMPASRVLLEEGQI